MLYRIAYNPPYNPSLTVYLTQDLTKTTTARLSAGGFNKEFATGYVTGMAHFSPFKDCWIEEIG